MRFFGRSFCCRPRAWRHGCNWRLGWRRRLCRCWRRLFHFFGSLGHSNRLRRRHPWHVLHHVTQRWRRSRLHALAGAGENVVSNGDLRRNVSHRRKGRLQGPDGIVEVQSVRLQYLGRHAARIADDGCEHDCSIDIAPAAASCGGGGRFENASDVVRYGKSAAGWRLTLHAALIGSRSHIGAKPLDVDLTRIENSNRVGVVAQRMKQMLQRHLTRPRRLGELGATRQRRTKIGRHRDLSKVGGCHAHVVSWNESKDRPKPLVNTCRNTSEWQRYSIDPAVGQARMPFVPRPAPGLRHACVRKARRMLK